MTEPTSTPGDLPGELESDAPETHAPEAVRATITLLQRRGIEAEVLIPLIRRMEQEIGRDRAHRIARDTIEAIAREQGEAVAEALQRSDLEGFHHVKDTWSGAGGDLQIETLREDAEALEFNVVGCHFAEMYRRMGAEDLGFILACSRDFALSEGYSDALHLDRRQTIMQGAAFCDFRYRFASNDASTTPSLALPREEGGDRAADDIDAPAEDADDDQFPESTPPPPPPEPTEFERLEERAAQIGGALGRMARKFAARAKPEVELRAKQARAAAEAARPHVERAAQQARDYVTEHQDQITHVAETGARIAADRIVPPMLRPLVDAAQQEIQRRDPPRPPDAKHEGADETTEDGAPKSPPRA